MAKLLVQIGTDSSVGTESRITAVGDEFWCCKTTSGSTLLLNIHDQAINWCAKSRVDTKPDPRVSQGSVSMFSSDFAPQMCWMLLISFAAGAEPGKSRAGSVWGFLQLCPVMCVLLTPRELCRLWGKAELGLTFISTVIAICNTKSSS